MGQIQAGSGHNKSIFKKGNTFRLIRFTVLSLIGSFVKIYSNPKAAFLRFMRLPTCEGCKWEIKPAGSCGSQLCALQLSSLAVLQKIWSDTDLSCVPCV